MSAENLKWIEIKKQLEKEIWKAELKNDLSAAFDFAWNISWIDREKLLGAIDSLSPQELKKVKDTLDISKIRDDKLAQDWLLKTMQVLSWKEEAPTINTNLFW